MRAVEGTAGEALWQTTSIRKNTRPDDNMAESRMSVQEKDGGLSSRQRTQLRGEET